MFQGYLDGLINGKIEGWALSVDDEHPIFVTLLIDNVPVESRKASAFRQDVKDSNTSEGNCGFSFSIPERWRDGMWHDFSVRVMNANYILPSNGLNRFRLGVGKSEVERYRLQMEALRTGSVTLSGEKELQADAPIALFAIFNKTGNLSWSQRRMLQELNDRGLSVILCQSTLEKFESFAQQAAPYCAKMIFRTNFGRDFASWALQIDLFRDEVLSAPYVLFLNDSMIGPFGSMESLFEKFSAGGYDVFGLTDSWDRGYHIQSSLFFMSKTALSSPAFWRFLYSYTFSDDRDEIIRAGEIGFSRFLLNGELKCGVHAPFEEISALWLSRLEERVNEAIALPEGAMEHGSLDERQFLHRRRGHVDYAVDWYINKASNLREGYVVNPQHTFWRELLLDYQLPLIKKELLLHNPERAPILWSMAQVIEDAFGAEAIEGISHDARLLDATIPPLLRVRDRKARSKK
ncbi:rhamnan synthesis F family protein [Fulvimarina endophytica]|nr:rhamnan synthesis F family protein [Fulvimarina endophytica]